MLKAIPSDANPIWRLWPNPKPRHMQSWKRIRDVEQLKWQLEYQDYQHEALLNAVAEAVIFTQEECDDFQKELDSLNGRLCRVEASTRGLTRQASWALAALLACLVFQLTMLAKGG